MHGAARGDRHGDVEQAPAQRLRAPLANGVAALQGRPDLGPRGKALDAGDARAGVDERVATRVDDHDARTRALRVVVGDLRHLPELRRRP